MTHGRGASSCSVNQNAPDTPAERTGADLPRWVLRGTALALIALGIVPTADWMTMAEPQRWWPTAVRLWIVWTVLVGALALLLARLAPRQCEAVAARVRARLLAPTPRGFSLFVAALTCALSVLFAWLLFRFHAASLDELSEQWQAHILASGRLVASAEPRAEFFSTPQTVSYQGRWFAHFPIGGPLLLAIGRLLRVPWLVNPVLAGAAVVAVYRFATRIGSEAQARLTALLFALSPFMLFMAATERDHVGTLLAVWIALAALARWHDASSERETLGAAAVVGFALGVATIIRPYDGALSTLAVGLFQLLGAGRSRARWRSLAVQALAGAVPIAVLLAVNHAMTGRALTFAYDVLNGPEHRPGFHMSPLGFQHTPRHGLYLVSSYLMRLNAALTGWPVPVVGVVALVMALQRRASRWDVLLAGLLAVTLIGYFLYWGEGLFNGPRFLYTVAPVFLLYLARLPAQLREHVQRPWLRAAALLPIPLWTAAAWATPVGISQPFSVWTVAGRTQQAEVVAPLLADAARHQQLRNALVFVNDGWQGRLSARLRALGVPPFVAQQLILNRDACDIQRRLDDAEAGGAPAAQQAASVLALFDGPSDARPLANQLPVEQVALVPGRPLPPGCRAELDRALTLGADMARLLPLIAFDSAGRLGGDVVYARDFGARNELLRDRFGGRAWYRARVEPRMDSLAVVLEPYRR